MPKTNQLATLTYYAGLRDIDSGEDVVWKPWAHHPQLDRHNSFFNKHLRADVWKLSE